MSKHTEAKMKKFEEYKFKLKNGAILDLNDISPEATLVLEEMLKNDSIYKEFMNLTFSEFPKGVWVPFTFSDPTNLIKYSFMFLTIHDIGDESSSIPYELSIELEIDILSDIHDWSLSKFIDVYCKEATELGDFSYYFGDTSERTAEIPTLSFQIPTKSFEDDLTLATFFKNWLEKVSYINKKVIEILNVEKNKEQYTQQFKFPPALEGICTQYLAWFGQLLENIGILVDVSVTKNNGKTSLTLSGTDDYELFKEIKKLFYQYLQLPYGELIPAEKYKSLEQQYAVESLKLQVENFKNQIQHKELIIGLQQAEIEKTDKELLLLRSMSKSIKREWMAISDKKISIGHTVDKKKELKVGLYVEFKPGALLKDLFKGKDN